MLNAKLQHQSEPTEAGMQRSVEFEIEMRLAGELAVSANRLSLGQRLQVRGFIAPRRKQSKTLLLHCTAYETFESDN